MVQEQQVSPFHVYGLSDRILTPRGIEYLLFFEADEQYKGSPFDSHFQVFKSPNGFHVVGRGVTDARGKKYWFKRWKEMYPESDYILQIENVLRPWTDEEFTWIYAQMPDDKSIYSPRCVIYYRDKAVWETFEKVK